MSGPVRPELDEKELPPADLWDLKVKQGLSPDSATKYVASIHGPPPAAARDATAALPRTAPTHSLGDDVNGAVASIAQGITGGLGDEILAAVGGFVANPLHPLKNFEKLRRQVAAPQQQFAANHPVADAGAQIGGALLGGAGAGAVKEAIFGPRAVALAAGKVPLLARAGRAAKDVATAGAIGGGVGLAAGEPGHRLESAQQGAEMGAGLSAGFKAGGTLLRATGVPALVRAITPRPATEASATARVLKATGVPLASHERLAAQDLLADFERSGLTIDDYLARAKANPDHPLYDLGPSLPQTTGSALPRRDPSGDPLVRRARGAQSIPSRGSAQISEFTNTRAEARPARVMDELSRGIGAKRENLADLRASRPVDAAGLLEEGLSTPRENVVDLASSLKAQRAEASRPKYAEAYAAEPIDDPDIQAAFKNKHFAAAYETGRRIAKQEGVTLPPLTTRTTVGEKVTKTFNPITVQGLDYAKQGLDDLIESRMSSGKMGRREARALRQKLSGMLDKVDAQRPEYAEARATFRAGSQAMEGADAGSEFLRTSGDELRARWALMTDAAKENYRKTALAQLQDKIASGANPETLLNQGTVEKLRTIAADPQTLEQSLGRIRTQSVVNRFNFFGQSGDDLERMWRSLPDDARQQVRQTALAQIQDRLSSGSRPGQLLDEMTRRKLRTIAASPADYDAMELAIRRQVQGAANDATITGGSPTARIMAEQADLGGLDAGALRTGGARALLSPSTLLSSLAESGVANRLKGMTEARVDALAPYLTAKGPDLEPKLLFLKALQEEFARGAEKSRLRGSRVAGQIGGRFGATP